MLKISFYTDKQKLIYYIVGKTSRKKSESMLALSSGLRIS